MKKSIQITAHIILWIVFTLLVVVICKLFLMSKPEAPLSQHVPYVVILELIMGLIFFYTTFFGIPFARKNNRNLAILSVALLFLLAFFSFPGYESWPVAGNEFHSPSHYVNIPCCGFQRTF